MGNERETAGGREEERQKDNDGDLKKQKKITEGKEREEEGMC